MKTLIVDVYRFVHRVSGAKTFSVIIAIIYVTILNMILLCGLSLLMEGWMPTSFIHVLFVRPYYFVTAVVMFGLTALYKPSKKAIAKEAKNTKNYSFIIVYSFAALILFLYMRYGTKINFNEKIPNVKPRKRPVYTESILTTLPNGWYAILKNSSNDKQNKIVPTETYNLRVT